jgi:hypothetical protein
MLLIPSLLVSAAALWLIFFILRSVVPRQVLNLGAIFRRREVTRHGSRLDNIERLIKGGFQRQVAAEFLEVFPFFMPADQQQLGAIEILNGRGLALILSASEKFAVPLEVLPVIEGLLQVRQETLEMLVETQLRFVEKKKAGGLPTWGADEFKRKLSEFNDRLRINERALRDQLRGVRDSFTNLKSAGDVVH